jgi:hypothetical protein
MATTIFAALPDPADPSFVAFGVAVGTVVGEAWSRLRRPDPEQGARERVDRAYLGTCAALGTWALANILELIS